MKRPDFLHERAGNRPVVNCRCDDCENKRDAAHWNAVGHALGLGEKEKADDV